MSVRESYLALVAELEEHGALDVRGVPMDEAVEKSDVAMRHICERLGLDLDEIYQMGVGMATYLLDVVIENGDIPANAMGSMIGGVAVQAYVLGYRMGREA